MTAAPLPLPIDPLLPELRARLEQAGVLVLCAPPGAGKTTRVPPALLPRAGPPGVDPGEVVVLEPRRVAARMAARRGAAERGEPVGGQVGYRVRFRARAGPDTRLLFVTEGVLLRRLQQDPLLEGVAVVVLDEGHERHLETDLCLAMLAEVRAAREDLRLVCMSATLETERLSGFFGGCPVLQAPGRLHPLQVRYLPRPDDRPPALQAAAGVRRALADPNDDGGDLLVFLPGVADIREATRILAATAAEQALAVRPLHGRLSDSAQDRAVSPAARRKVVLATNVAESSLTVEGVTTVVDTGWVKRLELDPRTGLERLRRRRVSRASAEQRGGRAGRTAPGRVLRCWTEGQHHALAEREIPAIRRVDLAGPVLQVRGWGCADPSAFGWFEPPPPAALQRADRLLRRLGAVDDAGITALGRALLELPVHPRLGRVLLHAHAAGVAAAGCALVALASERDVFPSRLAEEGAGGPAAPRSEAPAEVSRSDLLLRLERWRAAEKAGGTDSAWRRFGLEPRACRAVRDTARQLRRQLSRAVGAPVPRESAAAPDETLAAILLAGYPDRVAVRREPSAASRQARRPGAHRFEAAGIAGARYLVHGGREAQLDPASVVRDAPLLIAHDIDDGPRGGRARIRQATEISEALLRQVFPERMQAEPRLRYDPQSERVVSEHEVRYDALRLRAEPAPVTDRAAAGALLGEVAARDPGSSLALDDEARHLLSRVRFLAEALPEAGLTALDDDALAELARELSAGRIALAELREAPVAAALRGRLTPAQQRLLDREAPARLTVPSGARHRLEYPEHGPPVLAVKLQEVFGWRHGPRVARGRVPVQLHLLAPNGRPAQITTDLESFWSQGYADVRRELRGRYPKHPWPEDPWTAAPTSRPKRRPRR